MSLTNGCNMEREATEHVLKSFLSLFLSTNIKFFNQINNNKVKGREDVAALGGEASGLIT